MRWQGSLTFLIVAVVTANALAQEARLGLPITLTGDTKKGKDKDKDKEKDKPKETVIAEAPRNEIRPTLNPNLIGDVLRGYRMLALYSVSSTYPTMAGGKVSVFDFYRVQVPDLVRGAYKIGENESPRPIDRVYLSYSYFNQTRLPVLDGASVAVIPPITIGPPPRTVVLPDTLTRAALDPASVHRATFGLEKTFLDGDASIGLRLPMFGLNQDVNADLSASRATAYGNRIGARATGGTTLTGVSNAVDSSALGDLSIVLKYAVINDPDTLDVLSLGMVVTVPTGADIQGVNGDVPHSTLLQPYVGFIRNFDSFYVHGFSSIVFATDEREPTLLFNDVGLGWWAYRAPEGNLLRAVVPTVEAHLTTPLNHRDPRGYFSSSDLFSMTGGVHLFLGQRSILTLGVGVPVTGPRPYDLEAIVQFNFRF